MKTRAKRIILSLIFVALTGVSVCGLYKVLSWKDTSGDYFSSLAELKQLPRDTVDVVAIGSSKVYGSFDVSQLWEQEGIASFNLSIAGMDQKSAYYHLVELLKTQSPKVVFIEGSILYTDYYLDQGNVYRNTIVMAPSKNNVLLINAVAEDGNILDYVLRFPIVHSRYKELQREDFTVSNIDNGRLGFIPGFDNIPQTDIDVSILDNKELYEVNEKTVEWIESLDKLSKANGFNLVFYLAPQNIQKLHKMQYNSACQTLDEYGILHIDFNELRDEIGLNYASDLSDALHCNDKGARKVMNYLCKYLIENYDFADNRGKEGYERWDRNLAYISHERIENDIASLDIDLAYQKLLEMDNVLLIKVDTLSANAYLNGNTVYQACGQSNEYSTKINDNDYCYITSLFAEDKLGSIVYFGQTPYYLHDDNTTLYVAYDLIRDEVVFYKEF